MIITKKIAEAIVEKNKIFAPNKAKVILIHDDGRVVFAENLSKGALSGLQTLCVKASYRASFTN